MTISARLQIQDTLKYCSMSHLKDLQVSMHCQHERADEFQNKKHNDTTWSAGNRTLGPQPLASQWEKKGYYVKLTSHKMLLHHC